MLKISKLHRYALCKILPVFAIFIGPLVSEKINAQTNTYSWTPVGGDTLWNNKANWTPNTSFPNTANSSTQFSDPAGGDVTVNGKFTASDLTFLFGVGTYNFEVQNNNVLTLSGNGIDNPLDKHVNFSLPGGALIITNSVITGNNITFTNTNEGGEVFQQFSEAGTATFYNNSPKTVIGFMNTADAGAATIHNTNQGVVAFANTSGAGVATIANTTKAVTAFGNSASAQSATITGNSGAIIGFENSATADHANITIADTGSSVFFIGSSTAGSSSIGTSSSAAIYFKGSSKAGTANIEAGAGGSITFVNSSSAEQASLDVNNNNSSITFLGSSTAANSIIYGTSDDHNAIAQTILFSESSSAGNSVIFLEGDGTHVKFTGASKGATATFSMFSPDSLDISAHSGALSIGMLVEGGQIFLGKNNLTVGTNNTDSAFYGTIQDGGDVGGIKGSLTKVGTGVFTLTGSNIYTGATTITGGTLQLGDGTTDGTIAGGNIVNNSSLVFNGHSDKIIPNIISGKGSLTQNGSRILTLAGANTYSGGTAINAGTVILDNAKALGGTTGNLTFSNGTLDLNGNSVAVGKLSGTAGTITNNGANATLTATSNVSSSFDGALADGIGVLAFVKAGTGAFDLNGANTYSGGTTLKAGTLNINSTTALGTGSFTISGVSTIDSGGGSLSTNNPQFWNANFTFKGTRPLNLGTGNVTMNASRILTVLEGDPGFQPYLTVGGVISATKSTYGLTKTGNGVLILTGDNATGYTGTTTISKGTLQIGDGGTSGTIGTGKIVNTGILAFNRSDTAITASVISGPGSVQQNGGGTLTLSGVNTYTGGLTLNAGTLLVGSATALGKGNLTLEDGVLATNGIQHQINVNGNMIWDDASVIALTLTTDATTSEDVKVTGTLQHLNITGNLPNDKMTFDFTPVDLPVGDNNFLVMTVSKTKGFGTITATDFAFTSSDIGLTGTFRITGNQLFFDDGYEPSGVNGGGGSGSSLGISGSFAPAPEPGTWMLLGLGLGAAVFFRRRGAKAV